ncbi:hypothetical protein [Luteococcus peritonei]|uniref:Uncharacterized protein n=1 Tax=Luteococcus peritonei TaxID=88874 RepID=A0ABW4RVZ4_9ACTN
MDPDLRQLLDDATAWAEAKGRLLDADLLQQALDLRLVHDGFGDAVWPAGSAAHLMRVRYPSHGPVDGPEPAVLVATLDSYWRFLRSTGRMSSASATPADLLDEARRSRGAMARACADEGNRQRRAVLASHRQEEAGPVQPPEAAEVAPLVRESRLWRRVELLLAWLGEGIEVDQEGALPPDEARRAWEALGESLAGPGEEGVDPAAWQQDWAGLADCRPLHRLWWVAVGAGLVELTDARALVVAQEAADDEAWLEVGDRLVWALAQWADWEALVEPAQTALLLLTGPQAQPRDLAELAEFWIATASDHVLALPEDQRAGAMRELAGQMEDALAVFDDAGLWTREGEQLTGTALGWQAALVLDRFLDR